MKKVIAALWVVLIPMAACSADAQSPGRLQKIRDAAAITLGFPESSPPFSFLDSQQRPIGYTVEICEHVAQEIETKLGLAKLDVRYNPVTSATRIPLLANGTIDLECGNTTNNIDRHNFVSFAPTTFVAQVVLTAKKSSSVDVNDLSTFKGKAIAAQAGGQNFKVVSKLNAEGRYGITVIPTNDVAQTFMMMDTGRVAASANDDGLAYAAVAASKNPASYVVGSKGLELAPYGIMEPKDDPEFKRVVDEAVVGAMRSGKVTALYKKYFESPIPPRNFNLNYPMSDVLKRALENPTDSGDPANYK